MLSVPSQWRLREQRYRLIGSKCETCGNIYLPKRTICPKCRRKGKIVEYRDFSGYGRVVSWTVVHAAPEGFVDQAPYILAIIKLKEGPKILAQIVDVKPEEVHEGMEVYKVVRRIQEDNPEGIIAYGFKFTKI
ncbi:MAG: Zn-ribbon domain-containing OB-fold protein [Candidatus Anstonellales archaeon]